MKTKMLGLLFATLSLNSKADDKPHSAEDFQGDYDLFETVRGYCPSLRLDLVYDAKDHSLRSKDNSIQITGIGRKFFFS